MYVHLYKCMGAWKCARASGARVQGTSLTRRAVRAAMEFECNTPKPSREIPREIPRETFARNSARKSDISQPDTLQTARNRTLWHPVLDTPPPDTLRECLAAPRPARARESPIRPGHFDALRTVGIPSLNRLVRNVY